jgi:hypothetical protein
VSGQDQPQRQVLRIHGRDHLRGGSDPIPGLDVHRIVRGSVFDDADIEDAGSGDWTVASTGTGLYTITFDPVFASVPTVVFSATNNNAAHGGAPATNPLPYFVEQDTDGVDVDHVDVIVFAFDGAEDDGSFGFIAVGT